MLFMIFNYFCIICFYEYKKMVVSYILGPNVFMCLGLENHGFASGTLQRVFLGYFQSALSQSINRGK